MRSVSMLALLFSFVLPSTVLAEAVKPHDVIEAAADDLLVIVKDGKVYFDDDPDRFYAAINSWAGPLIDFPSFTRSVMGPYGTKKYYKSLSDKAARDAYKADYKRFVETFRRGLINTYAKGLLAFNGQKIEIIPPTEEEQKLIAEGKSVEVRQKIHGADKIYVLKYKMKPNKKGEWLLRNLVIEKVNVGQLYQNQFLAAMKKHNNDFAKVVDTWVVEAKNLQDKKAEKSASE